MSSLREDLLFRFYGVDDPRRETINKLHRLVDTLMISFCAMLGGAEGWEDIEWFGNCKADWFGEFLELPNGIPSHDTFCRVLGAIDPSQFQEALLDWLFTIQAWFPQQINIDGKTLRHSFDQASGQSALHLLNAWASESEMFLGQLRVEGKENEIVVIPQLLQLLELKGCLVSIDAMGCQTAIAQQVVEQEGDYLLALKENHPKLYEEVKSFFGELDHPEMKLLASQSQTVDADHGRIETRQCWVSQSLNWLEARGQWKGLNTVVCLKSIRESDSKNQKNPDIT